MTIYELLEKLEGVRFSAYRDESGRLTIGIGHLISKEEKRTGRVFAGEVAYLYEEGLSEPEVRDLLEADLEKVLKVINHKVKISLNGEEKKALTSFVFNIGTNAFAQSHLLKMLNKGKKKKIPLEMMRWIYTRGKISKSLVKRRTYEIMTWYGEFKDDE